MDTSWVCNVEGNDEGVVKVKFIKELVDENMVWEVGLVVDRGGNLYQMMIEIWDGFKPSTHHVLVLTLEQAAIFLSKLEQSAVVNDKIKKERRHEIYRNAAQNILVSELLIWFESVDDERTVVVHVKEVNYSSCNRLREWVQATAFSDIFVKLLDMRKPTSWSHALFAVNRRSRIWHKQKSKFLEKDKATRYVRTKSSMNEQVLNKFVDKSHKSVIDLANSLTQHTKSHKSVIDLANSLTQHIKLKNEFAWLNIDLHVLVDYEDQQDERANKVEFFVCYFENESSKVFYLVVVKLLLEGGWMGNIFFGTLFSIVINKDEVASNSLLFLEAKYGSICIKSHSRFPVGSLNKFCHLKGYLDTTEEVQIYTFEWKPGWQRVHLVMFFIKLFIIDSKNVVAVVKVICVAPNWKHVYNSHIILKDLSIIKDVMEVANVLNSKWKRQEELMYIIAYDILFGQYASLIGDVNMYLILRKGPLQLDLVKIMVKRGTKHVEDLMAQYQIYGVKKPCYVRVNPLTMDVETAMSELCRTTWVLYACKLRDQERQKAGIG